MQWVELEREQFIHADEGPGRILYRGMVEEPSQCVLQLIKHLRKVLKTGMSILTHTFEKK